MRRGGLKKAIQSTIIDYYYNHVDWFFDKLSIIASLCVLMKYNDTLDRNLYCASKLLPSVPQNVAHH